MKKNMAMKLVKALRSGEYHQGRGCLVTDEDYFCCLGVACNLSKVELDWVYRPAYRCWVIGGEEVQLPTQIQKEYGFYDDSGSRRDDEKLVIGGKSYNNLAEANDDRVPFSDIADYIEKNYKEL